MTEIIDKPIHFKLKGDFGVRVYDSHFEVELYKCGKYKEFHFNQVEKIEFYKDGKLLNDIVATALLEVLFGAFVGNSSEIYFKIYMNDGTTDEYGTLGTRKKKLKKLEEIINERLL